MGIAGITIFCNERFRLDNWCEYYSMYRSALDLHIIVNNGKREDSKLLRERFPDSVVLECDDSVMMRAYNVAYDYILQHSNIDAIVQIVNDIKISAEGLCGLYKFLFSESKIGAVSPALLKKDSMLLQEYGSNINHRNLNFEHLDTNKHIEDIKELTREVYGLCGGIIMLKVEMYKKIGPQDEVLYMYADEVDFGIRVYRSGYVLKTTKEILSWHQHVNAPGNKLRSPRTAYFMGRNHIYLARKHYGTYILLNTIASRVIDTILGYASCLIHNKAKEDWIYMHYFARGVIAGIFNNMDNNFK